jgi:hypothetical protein
MFLKPWRNLKDLKDHHKSWEELFVSFIANASQQDKDVIARSQYYYESKTVVANRDSEEEGRNAGEEDDCNKVERMNEHEMEDDNYESLVHKTLLNCYLHMCLKF